MAMGSFEQGAQAAPMAEINTTPLVDVMLVLLIIFMVCTPLMTQRITVQLPEAEGQVTAPPADVVHLSLAADGSARWNDEVVDDAGLQSRLQQIAAQQPQPALQVAADSALRYERVARLMAQARTAGVSQLGFVMLVGDGLSGSGLSGGAHAP